MVDWKESPGLKKRQILVPQWCFAKSKTLSDGKSSIVQKGLAPIPESYKVVEIGGIENFKAEYQKVQASIAVEEEVKVGPFSHFFR